MPKWPLFIRKTLTGEVVRGGGRELLADHDEAAVAGEADDLLVGHRDLGADRRRQAESHRPEAAGVEPPVGLGEVVVLRRPHLVLADVGGDDRVAAGRAVHLLDHELRLDLGVGRVLVARAGTAPASRGSAPTTRRGGSARRPARGTRRSASAARRLRVADDRDVGGDVLGDLGRVDVDVDELGARRELAQLAGDPVVEAGADRRRSGRPRPSRSWRRGCRACRASRATARAGAGKAPRPISVQVTGKLSEAAELAQLLGGAWR